MGGDGCLHGLLEDFIELIWKQTSCWSPGGSYVFGFLPLVSSSQLSVNEKQQKEFREEQLPCGSSPVEPAAS